MVASRDPDLHAFLSHRVPRVGWEASGILCFYFSQAQGLGVGRICVRLPLLRLFIYLLCDLKRIT